MNSQSIGWFRLCAKSLRLDSVLQFQLQSRKLVMHIRLEQDNLTL